MNTEQFNDAMNSIDDDMIETVCELRAKKKRNKMQWIRTGSLIAAMFVIVMSSVIIFPLLSDMRENGVFEEPKETVVPDENDESKEPEETPKDDTPIEAEEMPKPYYVKLEISNDTNAFCKQYDDTDKIEKMETLIDNIIKTEIIPGGISVVPDDGPQTQGTEEVIGNKGDVYEYKIILTDNNGNTSEYVITNEGFFDGQNLRELTSEEKQTLSEILGIEIK